MNIIDLDNLWVTINIREDKLSNFKKGQKIQAIVPALDNKEITLVVTYIKALGTYATWRATKTSGDWDVKTFEVHAKPTAKVPDLRPGMSVLIKEKE
jgi:HlyD family secretion protein